MLCILKIGRLFLYGKLGGFMELVEYSDPQPNGMDGEEEEDGG